MLHPRVREVLLLLKQKPVPASDFLQPRSGSLKRQKDSPQASNASTEEEIIETAQVMTGLQLGYAPKGRSLQEDYDNKL